MGLIEKVKAFCFIILLIVCFLYVEHPACVVFTQCESNECIVAALPSLAILLNKVQIIGTMLVPTGEVLLKAVKDAVCVDYHNLEKFAGILRELQNTSSIGKSLLHEYSKFSQY